MPTYRKEFNEAYNEWHVFRTDDPVLVQAFDSASEADACITSLTIVTVTASYVGGINDTMEDAAGTIAELHGAALTGSGCFIGENAPRDLEYEVDGDKADAMVADLINAGFRATKVLDDI